MLNKKLEVTENCTFLLTKPESNEGEDSQKDYLMAIVVLCIALFFILLLTVASLVNRHARRLRTTSQDSKEKQKMIESKNSGNRETLNNFNSFCLFLIFLNLNLFFLFKLKTGFSNVPLLLTKQNLKGSVN